MIYPPYSFNVKQLNEKYSLRRTANCIGAAYSGMLIFSFAVQVALIIAIGISSGSQEKTAEIIRNENFSCFLQIVLSSIMFTVPYILAARGARVHASRIINFSRPEKGLLFPFVLVGLGLCKLGGIAADMFIGVMSSLGIEPSIPTSVYGTDLSGVLLALITVAVIPALVEEFAMRGVVMSLLKPYGEGFSIIISAAVFGLMHRNLVQIPFAFAAGMGLAFITLKSGSIWTSVIVHFINNLISIVMYYISLSIDTKMQMMIYVSYSLVILAAGIAGVLMLSKKDERFFVLEKGETEASLSNKIGWFFSSPFMIVGLALTVVDILVIQVMY